ncbi:aspartate racemase [Marmoricola endophyticus]|uniref:Aspartate racemase n=1 Tax=Marmoricola endophyticus TaxID=2040280 RepID=A0A917FAK4_9ACTN|nr:amino acid racemase [Marmoricola endophyticus]GGF57815.1 aspartate racemase [Marmoricola endophyticus]
MTTIGLVGGMSWHSTVEYYRILNERVAAARGGHASAEVALQSLDFGEIRECQVSGDWDRAGALLARAARRCEAGGADVVALCTNLMHKQFAALEDAVSVPALHIADAVAGAARSGGWSTVLVLGTSWVMEESWYAERLARHGVQAVTPAAADRAMVDRVVFEELTQGVIRTESRQAYVDVIARAATAGAEAVVLACTEIGLLVAPEDSPLPVIDSARAHAEALADIALGCAATSTTLLGDPR